MHVVLWHEFDKQELEEYSSSGDEVSKMINEHTEYVEVEDHANQSKKRDPPRTATVPRLTAEYPESEYSTSAEEDTDDDSEGISRTHKNYVEGLTREFGQKGKPLTETATLIWDNEYITVRTRE
ncbi:hypothetical protein LTR24_009262 [Lithohypha guttulata]|uniref:Uncharacterized protein n=1 Tax=Lithohypha guttulata TaxID=1690604 RepID=A0ABR0JZD1_9EURO|nr:hypothetical protein LTR24_009262 [Lithohypha guttulata]